MIDMASILCRGVAKTYIGAAGAIPVVQQMDLEIAPQTLTLLVGPSGCGKTTLISLLAGLLTPTAGEVTALGRRLDRLSDAARAVFRSEHVGLVTQNHNLLPALTAAENVAVPLAIAGWSKRRAVQAAGDALADVGLSSYCRTYPRQLSGGQQQRVAIARAIVHQPSIVLCDEPTSALDHERGRSIMEILRRIAQTDGRAVVMVTHDERTFEYADRILRMDNGRIVDEIRQVPTRLAA